MLVEPQDGEIERRVVIAMIVDTPVLARIEPRWDRAEGLCGSRYANLVGGWCVRYIRRYGTAPGRNIAAIFAAWAGAGTREREMVALVEQFLVGLSDQYESIAEGTNSEFTIDMAAQYFTRVRAERAMERCRGAIALGQTEEAVKHLRSFDRMEIGAGTGVDIMTDAAVIDEAFRSKGNPFVTYPGALGKFFGDAFEADSFVAILAPEKRGKSFVMLDIGWEAMLQRRRVAFFQVGDMSQNQFMRRLMCRAARHPMRAGRVRWPTHLTREDDAHEASVLHEELHFDAPLDAETAKRACARVIEKDTRTNEPLFKLFTYPNSSVTVGGVAEDLANLARNGWEPQMVIIDYADILAPPAGNADTRDQINATWKQLRSLSQSLHCCVLTATQADAASYSATTLGRANFSEDKRKLAHTTAMFGLNATDTEKEMGLMRLNWIVLREEEYVSTKCVHVAGCLPLARPMVLSAY